MVEIGDDVLIYDLETRTYGSKPNAQKDRLRLFGCYSYKTKKYYLLTDKEQIQKIINSHRFLVGFNNAGTKKFPGYDNPILIREGINFKYKTIIDLRTIFKLRASQMKIKKGMLGDLIMSYSLDYISRLLGIVKDDEAKLKIDYALFKKDTWSAEEAKQVADYTKRDIEVTKKMYEWVEDYFSSFRHYLKPEDVVAKRYLTMSLAGVAYKAICKEMNWSEEKGQVFEDERIAGGYVSYPAGEEFKGNIYLMDFASLYPHCLMQANLYGRKKDGAIDDRAVWFGGDTWKVDGTYYADTLAGVGQLIKKWYGDRVKFKQEGDRREYSLKIFLNICYGILNNVYYEKTYDRVAGGDCTRLGRQWIKYVRNEFKKADYLVCYTDTDSVYIQDPFNDKEKVIAINKKIIDYIKSTVPFPQDTFELEVEEDIKYLWFFKGGSADKDSDDEMDEDDFINKPKGLLKKNYVFVTKDDRIIVKNLGIKKKSISALAKKVFWEDLGPKIKEGQIKFSKAAISSYIQKHLEKDLTLAAMRKEVGDFNDYKSQTSLPAQIAAKYSAGIHFLIPNIKGIGVGKGKKFCTIEEFKEHKMTIKDIDLDNVMKELDYFIKPVVTKNIFQF